MRFSEITLEGSTSIKLFDLARPRSTPYVARTIDGLGPTDVDVTLAQTSQGQGLYIGRREQLREITINAFLNPEYRIRETPEMLREAIYRLRPVNEDLSLDLNFWYQNPHPLIPADGERREVATTPVYIKRVEIIPFSKEQVVQIVLASTSGYLRQRTPVTLLDQAYDKTYPVFVNEGSADTGFHLEVDFNANTTYFGIEQSAPKSTIMLSRYVGDSTIFVNGDRLYLDTNIGSRSVKRRRGVSIDPIIGNLTPDSTWISLHPGANTLRIITDAPPSTYWWKVLEHTPKYTGV